MDGKEREEIEEVLFRLRGREGRAKSICLGEGDHPSSERVGLSSTCPLVPGEDALMSESILGGCLYEEDGCW